MVYCSPYSAPLMYGILLYERVVEFGKASHSFPPQACAVLIYPTIFSFSELQMRTLATLHSMLLISCTTSPHQTCFLASDAHENVWTRSKTSKNHSW